MLSTSLHRDSLGSSSPPRALRREWKRYKVHLPKSTSLPALRLLPSNRPIFTCSQCGFTNSHIPLCLWCSWTSEYATRAFEESMPRQRRVSAPAKAVWRHRATFHEAQGDSRRIAGRNYPVSSCPLLPLTTCSDLSPETDYMPLIASGLPDSVQPVRALLTKDKNNKRYSRRHGMVTGEAISDNNSRFSALPRSHPSKPLLRVRQRSSTKPIPLEFVKELPANHAECQRSNIMELTCLMSQESGPISVNVTASCQPVSAEDKLHTISHSQSCASLSPPQRTIRRKKRMTLLKQKSSRSLRSRASVPLLSSIVNESTSQIPPSIPIVTPQFRLGHPSRPYYTAIRPSMSRPNSPFATPPQTRAPSPSMPRSRNAADPQPSYQSTSIRSSHPTHANATIGFSLSGETELRMDLARWRSLDGVVLDGPSEYRFREMVPGNVRRKVQKSHRFSGRVKKFGMGIMELVLGRK